MVVGALAEDLLNLCNFLVIRLRSKYIWNVRELSTNSVYERVQRRRWM
jgi:hypothetical protein